MHYTRKGDNGKTSICAGKISKDSPLLEALGCVDELNSYAGVCRAEANKNGARDIANAVYELQNGLFILQAELARSDKKITRAHIDELETLIERAESEIPPQDSFIVTGETKLSAHIDTARAIARRAERRITALRLKKSEIPAYINRVSSLLYVLARLSALREGKKEQPPGYPSSPCDPNRI